MVGWTGSSLMALALWAGVAVAAPETDAVPVTLPSGESPVVWHEALRAAGLEIALRPRTAEVRIEALKSRWRLIAVEGGIIARELLVPAPRTEDDRREIAVLARAITMNLAPPAAPTAAPPPPPPPPAAKLREPVPPPPAPPGPEPAVEPDVPPTPEPAPIVREPVEPPPAADGVLPWWWPFRRKPREGPRVEAPPTALIFGAAFREDTEPAAIIGLQTDAVTAGRWLVTAEFTGQPARSVGRLADEDALEDFFLRQYVDIRGLMGVGLELVPEVRIGAVGGVAYRTYRQQFSPVLTTFVPVVGGQVELVGGGRFRVGVRVQVVTDAIRTELEDSTGISRTLAPTDINAALVLRVQPRQRPSPVREPDPLPPRTLAPLDLDDLPEDG